MSNKTVVFWGKETLQGEGHIFKAFFIWLGTMIVIPILPIIHFLGGTPNLVRAVYSCFVIIPVMVLFQLNAIIFFILAICGVSLNYNWMFYGAVKWIERKQLYSASKTKIQ
ncbi:MAG: hypothetical protein A2Y58_04585 [Chloroflexi bacterium RBG_13_51_52]|nr:MAG: hypothetical protein A2Y58_04585 [Chloroflexi bacterium RBG_13_51_52]